MSDDEYVCIATSSFVAGLLAGCREIQNSACRLNATGTNGYEAFSDITRSRHNHRINM